MPGGTAELNKDGAATPPADASPVVVEFIRAANAIEDKPYEHGLGHAT